MSNEKNPVTDETVRVEMRGPSGNAWAVMGNVVAALRRAGKANLMDEYMKLETSGDYENLLEVSGEYVHIKRI